MGCDLAFGMIVWTTRMATRVPVQLRGRVNSVDWFVSIGLAPASFALTGPVSRLIGVRDTLLVAAIVPAVSTFALLFLTGMRAEETRELQAPLRRLRDRCRRDATARSSEASIGRDPRSGARTRARPAAEPPRRARSSRGVRRALVEKHLAHVRQPAARGTMGRPGS